MKVQQKKQLFSDFIKPFAESYGIKLFCITEVKGSVDFAIERNGYTWFVRVSPSGRKVITWKEKQ